MLLIPAIDLKEGKCVRLRQGNMEESTVYGDDPVAMSQHWADMGAKRIHIVDLDGAVQGKPAHADVIERICSTLGDDVQIQIGGGIRSEESAEQYIEAGARYIIIGTKAVSEPHFIRDLCIEHPGHIIVGLDCKDGRIAIDGWSKLAQQTPLELAQHFVDDGVEAIIYTDISRDGMLTGANLEETANLASQINIPVIVSGGLATMEGVHELTKYVDSGILGAITGRAIYEGTIDYAEGAAFLSQHPSPYLEY